MKSNDKFKAALEGKKIPLLTVDHKWHLLFEQADETAEIRKLKDELNELVKRQGKINTELKELKKLKNNLMQGIVSNMEEAASASDKHAVKKAEESKRLINEINEKVEGYEDERMDLPREIDQLNRKLMLKTMENCYRTLQENTDEIERISEWIDTIRVELKTNVVKKQEMEIKNIELYSYMHDIFGPEVIDLFDIRYDVEARKTEILEKQRAVKERKVTKE